MQYGEVESLLDERPRHSRQVGAVAVALVAVLGACSTDSDAAGGEGATPARRATSEGLVLTVERPVPLKAAPILGPAMQTLKPGESVTAECVALDDRANVQRRRSSVYLSELRGFAATSVRSPSAHDWVDAFSLPSDELEAELGGCKL